MEALSEVITSPDAVTWPYFISTRVTYGKIIKMDTFDLLPATTAGKLHF